MPPVWIHFAWILSLFFQKWSEFQNFISQPNSQVLSSKCRSEWRGTIKFSSRHFFALISRQKTWSLKRLCFIPHQRCFIFCGIAAKCFIRRQACFTQSGPAFSDLSRHSSQSDGGWSSFIPFRYEAFSVSLQKWSIRFAPYDLSSIALRATDDVKMKNESSGLQYFITDIILTNGY